MKTEKRVYWYQRRYDSKIRIRSYYGINNLLLCQYTWGKPSHATKYCIWYVCPYTYCICRSQCAAKWCTAEFRLKLRQGHLFSWTSPHILPGAPVSAQWEGLIEMHKEAELSQVVVLSIWKAFKHDTYPHIHWVWFVVQQFSEQGKGVLSHFPKCRSDPADPGK